MEEETCEESDSGEALFFSLILWQEFKISILNLRSFKLCLLFFDWFIKNVFSVVNGCGIFFSSFSKSLKRSLLEARTFLKILVHNTSFTLQNVQFSKPSRKFIGQIILAGILNSSIKYADQKHSLVMC